MGLDVYCRVVVGVPLLDHAESEQRTIKETWYDSRTGEPYKQDATAHILTLWNGNQYEEGWSSDRVTSLPGIRGLNEWLKKHDLALFNTDNSRYISSDDLVGVRAGNDLSMRGGPLTCPLPDNLDAIIEWVKVVLFGVGLDVEPGVYITMELNS